MVDRELGQRTFAHIYSNIGTISQSVCHIPSLHFVTSLQWVGLLQEVMMVDRELGQRTFAHIIDTAAAHRFASQPGLGSRECTSIMSSPKTLLILQQHTG